MLILNTLSSIIIKKRGAIQDNTRNVQDIIYKDIIILNIQDNYTNVWTTIGKLEETFIGECRFWMYSSLYLV